MLAEIPTELPSQILDIIQGSIFAVGIFIGYGLAWIMFQGQIRKKDGMIDKLVDRITNKERKGEE